MAHKDRKKAASSQKRKPKREAKRRQIGDEGAFRDVVALDIPPNAIIATFPVDVRIQDLPRMKPTIIFEPEDEEPYEDVVVVDIPPKVLVGPFPIDMPLDGVPRQKPHIVFEPESEDD